MWDWDGREIAVGDTRFRAEVFTEAESTADRFIVWKSRAALELYLRVLEALRPRNIVEIGVAQGGSTAFISQTAQPARLVAIDRDVRSNDALDRYIDAHRLRDVVRPYYGIDQADRERLERIVRREFGGERLDLVIDDASHRLGETRASFNTLFPHLRAGGLYLIEDWGWAHAELTGDPDSLTWWPGGRPLTLLVFELIMACASREGLISEIAVDSSAVRVYRGSLEVDPDAFAIEQAYTEGPSRLLAEPPDQLQSGDCS